MTDYKFQVFGKSSEISGAGTFGQVVRIVRAAVRRDEIAFAEIRRPDGSAFYRFDAARPWRSGYFQARRVALPTA